MKHKKALDKNVYRTLTLVTQFGINMIVPICVLCALGAFLDNKCGTWWITIVLFFVGAVAGAQNVLRMAKRIYGDAKDKEREER